MIGELTVADLLQQARQHALTRKRHAGRANRDGIVSSQPDYPTAESFAAQALDARRQAHALDPDHADPAWAVDLQENRGVSHDAIVAFLTRYPTIP
jgi:hypothetical protein